MRTRALAASLLLLAACTAERASSRGENGGTLVIATPADADNLLPPLSINPTATEVGAMLFDKLAEPDTRLNTIGDGGFHPRLAKSWSWSPDSLAITFHLDPKAHWHDGKPVTGRDVVFTYSVYTDSSVGSPLGPVVERIDSVYAPDSATAVFRFKRRYPEQFFDATFQMRILPAHLLDTVPRAALKTASFDRQPVGSGPYRFQSWKAGSSLELVADTTYYRGRPHIDRLIWSIGGDFQASVVRFLSGDADFIEFLRPQDIPQVAKNPEQRIVPYASPQYGFLQFNLRNPLFADRQLRRALTMAVDRRKAVRSVYDTLAYVAVGPITHVLFTYDSTIAQIPFAPDSARAILDRLGWHMGADGFRHRSGRTLEFSMQVPTSSTPRMQLAVLLQEMFKQVGVKANIDAMEFATFGQRLTDRKFDAALSVLVNDPSPATIRQVWSIAAARAAMGSNYGAYESPVFDALIDSASAALDPAKAKATYRRAYQVIVDDAPAIWLQEPLTFAGAHKRVHPVDLRADMWFANLNEWTIPAAERTARDNIGLASARP